MRFALQIDNFNLYYFKNTCYLWYIFQYLCCYSIGTHSNNVLPCSQNRFLGSASVCPCVPKGCHWHLVKTATRIDSVFYHHIAYGMPSKWCFRININFCFCSFIMLFLANFTTIEVSGIWAVSRATCLCKWNEMNRGFRPPLCTYRLNWAKRTSWGWWDDWDDTVLQTQDSKFEPWRSEAEHATSRSRRLPTILTFTRGWGRNNFCLFKIAETGNRTPNSGVKGSGANHYPRAPAHLLMLMHCIIDFTESNVYFEIKRCQYNESWGKLIKNYWNWLHRSGKMIT